MPKPPAPILREMSPESNGFTLVPSGAVRLNPNEDCYSRLVLSTLGIVDVSSEEAEILQTSLEEFAKRLTVKFPNLFPTVPKIGFLSWKNIIGFTFPENTDICQARIALEYMCAVPSSEHSSSAFVPVPKYTWFKPPNTGKRWEETAQLVLTKHKKYEGFYKTKVKANISEIPVEQKEVPLFRFSCSTGDGTYDSSLFIQINGHVSFAETLLNYFDYLEASFPEDQQQNVPEKLRSFVEDLKKKQEEAKKNRKRPLDHDSSTIPEEPPATRIVKQKSDKSLAPVIVATNAQPPLTLNWFQIMSNYLPLEVQNTYLALLRFHAPQVCQTNLSLTNQTTDPTESDSPFLELCELDSILQDSSNQKNISVSNERYVSETNLNQN